MSRASVTTSPITAVEPRRASTPTPMTVMDARDTARWEGRAFGAIVLAAFLLYGIGSALADRPVGLALVLANSVAVALAGVIGFRLVRSTNRNLGLGYLAARGAEAILLAGGIMVARLDVGGAADTGYLLGMVVLSVGSIPFFTTLRRRSSVPPAIAIWGVCGYAALAVGAAAELATGRPLAVIFAVPGGLFELVLGCYLVCCGFRGPTTHGRVRQADA